MNILEKLNYNIIVAHVNHCLRKNAIADENYVKEYCKKRDIPIYIKKAKINEIAKKNNRGLEETGRYVRYTFFKDVAKITKSNKIAIAHNANDNAETIIMNIIRGTGISGLKGIEPNRNDKYIRPLIECYRNEIEEYCKNNSLKPRIDETNKKNDYTRNKVRNICIPYLEREFNPNILINLNRLGEIAREETYFIENIVGRSYEKLRIEENEGQIVFDLDEFNSLDTVIKQKLIVHTINKLCGTIKDIQKIHIEDIIKMCSNNIGNKYLIPKKYVKILIKSKKIYFNSLQ